MGLCPLNVVHPGRLQSGRLAHASIPNKERGRVRSYSVLAAGDMAVIGAAFLLGNRVNLGSWTAMHGTTMLSVLLPIYLWVASISGAYSGAVLSEWRVSAWRSARALSLAAASMLIIAYSFKVGESFSRLVFWIGTLSSVAMLVTARWLLGRWLLTQMDGTPFSTVLIDDVGGWQAQPSDVVLVSDQIGFDLGTDDPLQFDSLAKIVGHADRVLVACSDERAAAWAHVLKCMAVNGEILVPEVDHIGIIGIGRHGSDRTLVVSAGPLHLRDRIIKRCFDLSVSIVGLLVLSPLLIGIAIAVRIESPGPVLFRQQRIGRDNVLFGMLKFRSMYHDRRDEGAKVLTSRSDSRVTGVGDFLRRNSLDELPQLINVLVGKMSVVGPRPHALFARAADQLYWEIDVRYRHRHAVKPGLTGLAQIRGYRGATVSEADLTNRLSSDLEYLTQWSLRRDVWIILKTLSVLRHDNAF